MSPYILKISHRPGGGLATLTRRILFEPCRAGSSTVTGATTLGDPHLADASNASSSVPDDFQHFVSIVETRFGVALDAIHLAYTDGDGDLITVSSSEEFQDLLSSNPPGSTIRLQLGTNLAGPTDSVSAPLSVDSGSHADNADAASTFAESDITEVVPLVGKGKGRELDTPFEAQAEAKLLFATSKPASFPTSLGALDEVADWTITDKFDNDTQEEDGEPSSGASTPSLFAFEDPPALAAESKFPEDPAVPVVPVLKPDDAAEDPPEPAIPTPPLAEAIQHFLASLPYHAEALKTHFGSFLAYPHPQAIPDLFQSAPVGPPYQEILDLARSAREELKRSVDGVKAEAESIRGEFDLFRAKLAEDKQKFEEDIKNAMAGAEEAAKKERKKAKKMAERMMERMTRDPTAATTEPAQDLAPQSPEAERPARGGMGEAGHPAAATPSVTTPSATTTSTSQTPMSNVRCSAFPRDDLFNRRVSAAGSGSRNLSSGFDATLASMRQVPSQGPPLSIPSTIPGSFPSFHATSPLPTPIPSTSTMPYTSPWAEATPKHLYSAIKAVGLNIDEAKLRLACQEIWEENRGQSLDVMVSNVLEKVL
ncbi:BQ2448_3673 [Microbotryum intermedium]|uniref:BQ2448_3673 protein n=1 Tax=Microbotryum intermedium TaxID=269621 RepID=A0A238FFL3_9BASI|nr:BQ2448_3673 [Microbotryum intermedium]